MEPHISSAYRQVQGDIERVVLKHKILVAIIVASRNYLVVEDIVKKENTVKVVCG